MVLGVAFGCRRVGCSSTFLLKNPQRIRHILPSKGKIGIINLCFLLFIYLLYFVFSFVLGGEWGGS